MATVTKSLQNAVKDLKHVNKVFFNSAGGHYFHVHNFEGKQYGFLKRDNVVVGQDPNTQRNIFKSKPVANPDAEVVATMTRKEVLNAKIADEAVVAAK